MKKSKKNNTKTVTVELEIEGKVSKKTLKKHLDVALYRLWDDLMESDVEPKYCVTNIRVK